MKSKSTLNKYFSVDNYIGTVISQRDYDKLFNSGKIYNTICFLTGAQAAKTKKKHYSGDHPELRAYGGIIVADSRMEAVKIAKQRGYGEGFLNDNVIRLPKESLREITLEELREPEEEKNNKQ